MSDIKLPPMPELDAETIEQISGGNCNPDDVKQLLNDLTENYEALVGFVSHVIERVAG